MLRKIILLSLCWLAASSAAAEMYQRLDENGPSRLAAASSPTRGRYQLSSSASGPKAGRSSGDSAITLTGRIIDPRKILLQGITDEGVQWSGELDLVGRRAVDITAYNGSAKIATAHPDENGQFAIRTSVPVSHITLLVSGGGLFIKKRGPWQLDAVVDLDLAHGVFVVDGHVRNVDGTPVKREMITAYDSAHVKLAFAYTNSKGYFRFWSNQPLASLETNADRLRLVKNGPWSRAATVTLARERSRLFTITGRVTDRAGMPTAGVRISALFEEDGGKSAMSDARGYYKLLVDRKVKLLFGYYDLTKEQVKKPGSWMHDATVDFVFQQGGVFTLQGRVTDRSGKPAAGTFVYGSDAGGSRVKTTRTDRNGAYTLLVAKPVQNLTAYRMSDERRAEIPGPWNGDATVDIRLP